MRIPVLIPLRTGKGSNGKAPSDTELRKVLIPLRTGKGSNLLPVIVIIPPGVLIPLRTGKGSNPFGNTVIADRAS